MKICDNGVYREMTEEEIAALTVTETIAQPPTTEDRLQALESAMLDMIMGG